MKSIFLAIINISMTLACSNANEPNQEVYLKIHVNDSWLIAVSKRGSVSVNSMNDAHPSSMVRTDNHVVSYNKIVAAIKDHDAALTESREERLKYSWAEIPDEEKKTAVPEQVIYEILSQSSGNWKFPGISERLRSLLDKSPLLKDKKMQNKALQFNPERSDESSTE